MANTSLPILVVEDSEDDFVILSHSFAQLKIPHPLHRVQDGQEAIEYLLGRGPFSNRAAHPVPALILLDLKLPRRSGIELLLWMRENPIPDPLITIVFTSSREPRDIQDAYRAGATAYLVKPTSMSGTVRLVDAIRAFWLTENVFPRRELSYAS